MRLQRVLVATDLASSAEVTYAHVAAFVRAFGTARVDLLHVDDSAHTFVGLIEATTLAAYRTSLRETAEAELARHVDVLRGLDVPARGMLAEGTPWQVILGTAERTGAELIALTRPPMAPTPMVGSTTKRVLRRTGLPVLVVEPEGYDSPPATVAYRRIFYPTDFSHHADRGLRHARALALAFAADLILAHVEPRPFLPSTVAPSIALADVAATLASSVRRVTEARLAKTRAALEETGEGLRVETLLLEGGDPAERLARAADEETDLFVVPSHGRGAVKTTLLGSVTERLLRRTMRPTLVLRRGSDAPVRL